MKYIFILFFILVAGFTLFGRPQAVFACGDSCQSFQEYLDCPSSDLSSSSWFNCPSTQICQWTTHSASCSSTGGTDYWFTGACVTDPSCSTPTPTPTPVPPTPTPTGIPTPIPTPTITSTSTLTINNYPIRTGDSLSFTFTKFQPNATVTVGVVGGGSLGVTSNSSGGGSSSFTVSESLGSYTLQASDNYGHSAIASFSVVICAPGSIRYVCSDTNCTP